MSQLFGMGNALSTLTGKYDNKVNKENAKAEAVKNTLGNPKLSETASNYYEELKSKHGDVEFVLVDKEHLDSAKEYTSSLVTDKSMIVLISEDEVEKMAADVNVRSQNEKLIEDAKAQMPDLLQQLKEAGNDVKSFGIEFNNDGTASYFAFVENMITASSMEDLIGKIKDKAYEAKADSVMTEKEKMVGQNFDFSL